MPLKQIFTTINTPINIYQDVKHISQDRLGFAAVPHTAPRYEWLKTAKVRFSFKLYILCRLGGQVSAPNWLLLGTQSSLSGTSSVTGAGEEKMTYLSAL